MAIDAWSPILCPTVGQTAGGEELKKYVQRRLPSYMAPAAWVSLKGCQ
jgi:hypothetical protein